MTDFKPYKTVVLDIEGTTTPITFVHDVLFPYVTQNLDQFLTEYWSDPECIEKVEALRVQANRDVSDSTPSAIPILPTSGAAESVRKSVVENVRWQMSIDRKIGPLKSLQGYMWRSAYESGKIKGAVYDDVVQAMERWTKEGAEIYIYSSGSVEAQKLLFGWSDKGDLLHFFKGHFDTGVGLKIETDSYSRIAKEIGREPMDILFVSDNVRETDAAMQVGYQVAVAKRPGNAPLDSETKGYVSRNGVNVPVVESFDQIFARTIRSPMISFHSHSGEFCHHAKGKLEEVVLRAIELGFTAYGLSEHMPRTRVEDLYPEEEEANLTPEDTTTLYTTFLSQANHLRQKYASQISLLVGIETENIHPTTLSELSTLLKTHPSISYTVGSVHHVQSHPIDFSEHLYTTAETALGGTENLFLAYFDAQYELLEKVKPTVVGHFDLVRIFRGGWELTERVWGKVRRNVGVIVGYGGLVEINSRAWKKGLRNAYPQRDILKYMQSQGVKFTISDDSHGPADVGMHYDKLHGYLKEEGIDTLHFPALNAEGVLEVRAWENVLSCPSWNRFS
ncbi:Enolase-phosphatase E1 [Rhizophlyctis rosea]|uniref:Enolase-phosphatase E1 n=1 Tax=Rhizophlyctis rosea TaxID=64517 RepID=A0AAD5SJU2_9FUNG|nr:Enolase-phosphatase E1 [Rhizophlyctis rosea]